MSNDLSPIPVNPGGLVAPEHVVGRERECAAILDALGSVGVVLTGERRMGKTSLARLVAQRAGERGWTVVRHSAEGYASLAEFSQALIKPLESAQDSLQLALEAVRKRWRISAGPVTIEPEAGERLLDEVLTSAVEATDERLLLVLDELPLFAKSLERRREGDGAIALHALRRLRQTHPERLRMLCLGSVGFHHVAEGAPGALNDLDPHRLGPLAEEDAITLARRVLRGGEVATDDEEAVARSIARAAESVPYYVHKVVAGAKHLNTSPLTSAHVEQLADGAISGVDDPWELKHYRQRIPHYYGLAAPTVTAILDAVASEAGGLDSGELAKRVSASRSVAPVPQAELTRLLGLLESDHYLIRDGDKRRFAFGLVRRAWIRHG